MEFDEEIREFLIESNENLAVLDQEIVLLEQRPDDIDLISSAFRTIHTIKGTCGFFGFDLLGSVTHVTENILSQVRAQQRALTPELITLVLEAVDHIKTLLGRVETTGSEGVDDTAELRRKLEQAYAACPGTTSGPKADRSDPQPAAVVVIPQAGAEPAAVKIEPAAAPTSSTPSAAHPLSTHTSGSSTSGSSIGSGAAEVSDTLHAESKSQTAAEAGENSGQLADSTIRVDVALLNRLMNLVGELVLARNQLLQETSTQNSGLQQTSQRLNLITSELQEGLMKTRMQPIGTVWNKLPRVVRDLAAKCGKRVHLVMEGGGTELDKTVLEAIKDPLTHLVRNSCDHGIELPENRLAKNKNPEGTLLLRAYHEGGVVNIEISDDGAGIDAERVKAKAVERGILSPEQALQLSTRDALHLIFKPGFSTAAQVTSISGRGVGMDVVKTNIEKIGGSVDVSNREEGGTAVRIKIPLTLAIIPGLVVTLTRDISAIREGALGQRRQDRFIVPQANLLELVRLEGAEIPKKIEHVHGTPVFHHRGKLLPLVYLRGVLGQGSHTGAARDTVNIVVLQAEQRQLGLVVDEICDTQEIVVKPLGRQLKSLSCYVGATIMGDGRPALILDVAGVARLAGLGAQTRNLLPSTPIVEESSLQPQMLLLFRAGTYDRLAVPLALVDRLEEISADRIERASGGAVVHYRGDILPLVSLTDASVPAIGLHTESPETVQVIVFANGDRRVGLLVDQVMDIVSVAVDIRRQPTKSSLLLGSALVGDKITDLLDLHAVVEKAGENWLDPAKSARSQTGTVLLVDPANVPRQMMATFLGASGYVVRHVSSYAEANLLLREHPSDVVMVASGLPADEKRSLQEDVRADLIRGEIPMIELLDREGQTASLQTGIAIVRSERQAVLHSLSNFTNTRPSFGVAA